MSLPFPKPSWPIEQLTGTLRSYDALVDFATVHLSLEEVYQLSNVEQAPQGFGDRVGGCVFLWLERLCNSRGTW